MLLGSSCSLCFSNNLSILCFYIYLPCKFLLIVLDQTQISPFFFLTNSIAFFTSQWKLFLLWTFWYNNLNIYYSVFFFFFCSILFGHSVYNPQKTLKSLKAWTIWLIPFHVVSIYKGSESFQAINIYLMKRKKLNFHRWWKYS